MKQIAKTLESVEIPKELQFFYGGKTLGLDSESEKFAKFLLLDECTLVIGRNKMWIHLEAGNIYFNNINRKEGIYNFLRTTRLR